MLTEVKLRGIRMSAQKLRTIARCFCDTDPALAIKVLALHCRKSTSLVRRAISSVVGILGVRKQLLNRTVLRQIRVDKAPSRRTPKARAKGRADFAERQTSHITITLETKRYGKEG